MNSSWVVVFLVELLVAYLIANYQRSNGYSFYKSFIGALIGLVGLTLLTVQAISD